LYGLSSKKKINMDVLLEILKYILPAIIVFLTVWIMLRTWSRNEEKKRKSEFNMHITDDLLPIRLLVIRVSRPEFSARQLQTELLTSITHEFEHNLAQQTYVSNEVWDRVKLAKNQNINLINEATSELKADASGPTLGKLILERLTELNTPPSRAAINAVKQEVRTLFL